MRWSEMPFSPSQRMLRQFAGLWVLFFAGCAAWQWFNCVGWAQPTLLQPTLLLALALTIGPMGLVRPRLIRPIFVGWMCLAFPIGWVVSHVVLAGLFYFLFAPLGLFFRLIGRDALALRPNPGQNTYWVAKPAPADVRSYFRQS